MNLASWLQRRAMADPARPALFRGRDRVADYGAFADRAARLAGWLAAQGIAPGDRVTIFMKNVPDYLIALYGIWYAGAVAVPINAKLHGREAAFILGNSSALLALTSPGPGEALAEAGAGCRLLDISGEGWAAAMAHDPVAAPLHRAPDDLAWLFYTSGTTGRPKGVMISHRMLTVMSLAYFADVDAASGED